MTHRWPLLSILSLALGALLLTGCDATGVSANENSGSMSLSMTGSSTSTTMAEPLSTPSTADSIRKALVTISEVSVVPVSDTSNGDSTETGVSVLSDENVEVDLMELQTGLDTTLVEFEIPAGDYSQIRLITADAARVTFNDDTQRDVMIASGQQTGLKVNFDPFTIDSAQDSVDVTLNWSVQESLKGNSRGQFVITPVIDATATLNETEN